MTQTADERTPDTVSEAVQQLVDDGYTTDFALRPALVHCGECQTTHSAEGAVIERTYRFEGASDPDDEAIVIGMRCPHCGARGVLVSGYGPSADPDEIDVIRSLVDGR